MFYPNIYGNGPETWRLKSPRESPRENGKPHSRLPISPPSLVLPKRRTINGCLGVTEIQSLLTEFYLLMLLTSAGAVTEEGKPISMFGGNAVALALSGSRFLRFTMTCMMNLSSPPLSWPFYPFYQVQLNHKNRISLGFLCQLHAN